MPLPSQPFPQPLPLSQPLPQESHIPFPPSQPQPLPPMPMSMPMPHDGQLPLLPGCGESNGWLPPVIFLASGSTIQPLAPGPVCRTCGSYGNQTPIKLCLHTFLYMYVKMIENVYKVLCILPILSFCSQNTLLWPASVLVWCHFLPCRTSRYLRQQVCSLHNPWHWRRVLYHLAGW